MTAANKPNGHALEQHVDDNAFNLWCVDHGVRFARKTDEDEILALLAMSHSEVGLFKPDRDKVREVIRLATEKRGGIIGVIDDDSRLVASVGMLISDAFWYTREQALFELWTFVHPQYRRSHYAKLLIEFSKQCSDWFREHGQNLALFSAIVTNVRTKEKCKLYARHLPPIGQFFLYNAPKQGVT